MAAQELDTGPGPRRGEIGNLRLMIRLTISMIMESDMEGVKIMLPAIIDVKTRLNELANNPAYAGKHQHLNN